MGDTRVLTIYHSVTGEALYRADLPVDLDGLTAGHRLGAAIKQAVTAGANLRGADLQDANLAGAKRVGATFWDADLRGANFEGADLRGADLWGADLRGASFEGADLRGAKLRGAELEDTIFEGAKLRGKNLESVNLRDANLQGANFGDAEVPVVKDLHQRVYAAASKPDALDMDRWHACETTHCRAGWIVHLAGEPGYALESRTTTAVAAHLIAEKSGIPVKTSEFYISNKDALEVMRKAAELEAESV